MISSDLNKIPSELKAFPQWVCYQQNKIPVNPKTGDYAKADDPGTWGEFDQAVRHWEAHRSNGIAGVGFEFSPEDPYTGVDLDKCRNPETGEIEPWVLEIVRRLNSYTEISPSGTGLHIIIKASVPPGGNRQGRVEMYDTGRYFTVTGHHCEDTPTIIEDRQTELEALHTEIFGNTSEESKQESDRATKEDPGHRSTLSDDELIDKICKSKNANKFAELMRGDIDYLKLQCGYPSASEADLALVMSLAFWTGKDAVQMDRIFRLSGLMRPKWNEYRGDRTYGEMTISKAITKTKEVWKGAKKKRQSNKKQNDTFKEDTAQSVSLIDKLNKKHAIVMLGGKCVIMNEVIDPVFNRPDVTFSSVYDFKNCYSNQLVTYIDGDGKSKKVPLSEEWLKSSRRRQYDGIVFSPGSDISRFYNLYRGFAVTPVKGDWSLYRQMILEVIAAGNEENYNYLMKWMARLVQHPGGERSGSAVVMRGKMGVGKGVFVSQYGEIFGSHFLHITNPNHLVHRFNNHLKDCLLCFVDEGIWAGDKPAEGILKGMITEKYIMVEPKGKDAFPVKNLIHLIFASNNDWVVPAGLEERRFFVLDVADKHMQDYEYFAAIINQMNNGGREALLYDLLAMDISDINLRKIPRTNALLDQIIHSMSSAQKFWLERLRAGTLIKDHRDWEEFAITEDLYSQYLDFAQAVGERYKLIDKQFSRELRRLCPDIKRCRRTISGRERWVLCFPVLEACRKKFETVVGIKVNWEMDPEEADHDASPF